MVANNAEKPSVIDKPLRVSESRYRRLFETSKDGILLLNSETTQIEDVNPFLMALLGYSYDEFLGKKLWEIGAFKDTAKALFYLLHPVLAKMQLDQAGTDEWQATSPVVGLTKAVRDGSDGCRSRGSPCVVAAFGRISWLERRLAAVAGDAAMTI